jgi:hypothetical protein
VGVLIGVLIGVLAAVLVGTSPAAQAQAVTDSELRGYKGGLVEIQLRNATTVRGVLYYYTASHLELEVANDATVKLHRSWVVSVKAAPVGSNKSPKSVFPRRAGQAYRAGSPPPRETPREAPRREMPPLGGEGGSGSAGGSGGSGESGESGDSGDSGAGGSGSPGAGPGAADAAPRGVKAPTSAPGGGPLSRGLVFQLRLGGNLLTFVGTALGSWLNGSFLIGYKTGKLTIGLGLEMSYAADDLPNADPDPIESSTALVLFQPTLEYYLANKGPLAVYLGTGLHVGFVHGHVDPGKDETDTMVGFHAGVGMRYFMHPRFALGLEGGLRGVWVLFDYGDDNAEDDNRVGLLSIYGAATLTAIW